MVSAAIRAAQPSDFDAILAVINDAASAYKGIIPASSWVDPYMSEQELETEINDAGIIFYVAEIAGEVVDEIGGDVSEIAGEVVSVMGIQPRDLEDDCGTHIRKVALIRHAYTRTSWQRKGIGKQMLNNLLCKTTTPTLIGTWSASTWAIQFYEKNGFRLVDDVSTKDDLLHVYWFTKALGNLNDGDSEKRKKQMAASVVLADSRWCDEFYGAVTASVCELRSNLENYLSSLKERQSELKFLLAQKSCA